MSTAAPTSGLDWPLMKDNITAADVQALRDFLDSDDVPRLTQSDQVAAFEREWSEWLGVRYSVFVSSGSSANLITMAALRWQTGAGEVIVPTLTWVSDIASVLQNGFDPVFVDIDPATLAMDTAQVLAKVTPRTKAVFLTHILGYNGLRPELLDGLAARGIPLVEDACESHGATFRGRKVGTFGLVSNFSFYYAHHMSTIEGGMVSTDHEDWYERIRMLRGHGLVREATSAALRSTYAERHPDLNPDFIFAYPAYNVRSTELNAVIGRSQLRRLDAHNRMRKRNLDTFLAHLDSERYFTGFATEGSSNYAFTLVLKEPNPVLRDNVMTALRRQGVEYRRGTSGGGNQLRQPYLRSHRAALDLAAFPRVEHVHFYGFYIGNYPSLDETRIVRLCSLLNELPESTRVT
jgi:CDP-4-dehydro-6-deoxyglucose reductase, E1